MLVLLIIFFDKQKITLKNFFKFVSSYVLIPVILFLLLSTFNSYQLAKRGQNLENKDLDYIDHLNSNELKILRVMSKEDISSGRFEDWNEILIKMSGKNIIYGFGAQGDRYLINQTASNGLIYAYSSSGLVGLIIFLIFLIMVGFKTLKIFIYQFKKNTDQILHCIIILILSLRAILETSYAVFSIDLIIFILALSFIFDNNIKINDIKIKLLND